MRSANTWESLPLELWIATFAQIDSLKDLIQCRLVCKAWDPLAETAMFSQTPLHFPERRSAAVKLHYHLARKPFLGLYIREVLMKCSVWADFKFTDPLIVALCRLVFTPEIEKLGGEPLGGDFYKLLLKIINDSPQKFSHFKAIAACYNENMPYSQVLFKVKDTLEFVDLSCVLHIQSPGRLVLGCLDKFVKLKEVRLSLERVPGIEAIEVILQKLQSVESLTLDVLYSSFTHKSEKMKTVFIPGCGEEGYTSTVVDYVAYKYPKLQTFKLTIPKYMGRHLDTIFQSMEQFPHIHIHDTYTDESEDLWMLGYRFKSTTNKVKIRYSDYLDDSDETGAQIDISRTNSTQHTDFNITLSQGLSHAFVKQLLSSVCTGSSDIIDLEINLHLYKDPADESEHEMTFTTF